MSLFQSTTLAFLMPAVSISRHVTQYPGPHGYTRPTRYPDHTPTTPTSLLAISFTPVYINTLTIVITPYELPTSLTYNSQHSTTLLINQSNISMRGALNELVRDRDCWRVEDNDVGDKYMRRPGQINNRVVSYSEDEEGDNEEVQNESEESEESD
ncbi:hypothetical protein Tco_1061719 [Tanacetum coccineum]